MSNWNRGFEEDEGPVPADAMAWAVAEGAAVPWDAVVGAGVADAAERVVEGGGDPSLACRWSPSSDAPGRDDARK